MSEQTTADRPPQFSTASCKSCSAPIIWTITTNNERMPVDAEPVAVNTGGGNVILTERGGAAPLATVVSNPAKLFGKKWVWRLHMATCPHAEYYRGKAKRQPGRRGWVAP